MSDRLFLQFQDQSTEQLVWFHFVDDQINKSGNQSLDTLDLLKEQFQDSDIIVIVPSTDCLVTTVKLPTRQRRQQLQAIPFALEEQIADDIENIHFAVGKHREDNLLPVIAVSKEKMTYWSQILNEASISTLALLPECALLEAPIGAWSIFQHKDSFIVNQNGNCWSGNADQVSMMLMLSIQQLSDDDLPGLLYWGEEQIPAWVTELGLETSHQTIVDSQQSLLARFDAHNVNLQQGDFVSHDDWQESWNIWRRVAVIALVAILLKFTMMGFEVFRLSGDQAYYKSEIANSYHQVAPGARIVDAERQMRQLMSERKAGLNSSNSFLLMLSQVGKELATIPDIKPTNIHYNSSNGEIRLDLIISNLPLLDKLKEQLSNKGLTIEVGAATAQGNSYSGRLIIRSGS